MNQLSIIILAAGQGTRMKSTLPKVLHKISGREMLYYSIKEAQKISNDVHIVLYHQAELIKKTMNKYFENITYHIQDHNNFPGTGGAIREIKPICNKTLILNGDMPLIESVELQKLITKSPISMSVLKLDDATGYGRVVVSNNKVVKIVEQKDCTNDELEIKTANAGIYCFDTDFLLSNIKNLNANNAQKEYYITDLIALARSQNIEVNPIDVEVDNFIGVNSKYDLSMAQDIHQRRIKKRFMQDGIIMHLSDTIYIDDTVVILGESIIENGVSLLGYSRIVNSHIKSHSVIDDGFVKDSQIGPMARIRPHSIIRSSQIGNFVEIKKSTLNNVKAGHLSYLGDSTISSGTNIGAGVITCNYDGKNKYQTIIGKNVFIGSDTQLIAPLVLEDDCIVGAGSTITKDIKSGELVLTRAKIKIIANYFYKFFNTKKN